MTTSVGQRMAQYIDGNVRLSSGPGAAETVIQIAQELGARSLLLVTSRSVAALDGFQQLSASLSAFKVTIFAEALPLVPDPTVLEALRVAEQAAAEVVVGIGAGSAIDTAKAVALTSAEGTDWERLRVKFSPETGLQVPSLSHAKMPIIAVPLTPAGAETTASVSVNVIRAGRKISVLDPGSRPRYVIHDPALASSTPSPILARATMNALANALEAVYSKHSTLYSSARGLAAARFLVSGLNGLATERIESVARLLAGGYLAAADFVEGDDFQHCRTGLVHGLAHAISGSLPVGHGDCYSVLLPVGIRYNYTTVPDIIDDFGAMIGAGPSDGPEAVITAIDSLRRRHGTPTRLRDIRIPRDSLQFIADASLNYFAMSGNPRPVRESGQIVRLLEAAW